MEQHLSQYKIFYEVARCGNISKAARELYISQPAISKAVSKLEENLGTRLFSRNSRGVLLTREGEILYQHISTAFEAINKGEKELKRIHDFRLLPVIERHYLLLFQGILDPPDVCRRIQAVLLYHFH